MAVVMFATVGGQGAAVAVFLPFPGFGTCGHPAPTTAEVIGVGAEV